LVRVVTNTAHGLATNDVIRADAITIGGAFSTYCNAQWSVTVIDATTFDFQGSAYPGGTHDEDTGVCGPAASTITAVAVAASNIKATTTSDYVLESFRTGPSSANVTASSSTFYFALSVYLNGVYTHGSGGVSGNRVLLGVQASQLVDKTGTYATGAAVLSHRGIGDIKEAVLGVRSGSLSADVRWVGVLYNAFFAAASVPGETTVTGLDGHNWICLTNNCAVGSIWITEA
jgi:hypothetical protein